MEQIACRECTSPDCHGCNLLRLEQMLESGKFNSLMDEKRGIKTEIDVRPVVRGKWIQTTQPMGWRDEECAECSVCGEDFVLDEWAMDEFTNLMNFCPNCGADMREKKWIKRGGKP